MTICLDDIKNSGKVLLTSIIGGAVLTYITCPGCNKSISNYLVVTGFSAILWVFLWKGNTLLVAYLNKKVSWIAFPLKRFALGVVIAFSYTIVITIVIMECFQYAVNFSFGSGYTTSIYYAVIMTVLISLFFHGKKFLLSWKDAANSAEKLQKENAIARYESLKSQVNPHFLFNSLNALTNLVYEDPDKASKFIKQLSEVYRYVLDTREREVVDLSEELHFIGSYLFLQKIRFGDNLKTSIRTSENGKVAPLALQLLIENAIKHNIISSEAPLMIEISDDDDFIIVENNVQKKNTIGESPSGMGLENICRRYDFLSERKVEIVKSSQTFKVKLPRLR